MALNPSTAAAKPSRLQLFIDVQTKQAKALKDLTTQLGALHKNMNTFNTSGKKGQQELGNAFQKTTKNVNIFGNSSSKVFNSYQRDVANAHGVTDKLFNKLNSFKGLSILGTGFGIKEMIRGSIDLRQELLGLRNSFQGLSDASGNTNAALKTYYSTWSKTGASFDQISQAMTSLGETGLKPTTKQFGELTALTAQLSHVTGVSGDAWASLSGKLVTGFHMSTKSIRQMTSELIAADLSSAQLTTTVNAVNETLVKLSDYSMDGERSAMALTRGFVGATKALVKLGVDSQKATEFISRLVDPERLSENQALLAQLGVSYGDIIEMMESASGKEMFFDKVMNRLPEFSRMIAGIRDPFARMNIAKSL